MADLDAHTVRVLEVRSATGEGAVFVVTLPVEGAACAACEQALASVG